MASERDLKSNEGAQYWGVKPVYVELPSRSVFPLLSPPSMTRLTFTTNSLENANGDVATLCEILTLCDWLTLSPPVGSGDEGGIGPA